jgi:hypothetical protein
MENDSPSAVETPKPKLRWFQYSLRSLFILTFLAAIACSWLAVTMQNQRKQKAAAEAIEKMGGRVSYELTWLGRLLRDDSLVAVTCVLLDHTRVTDAALVHLQGLRQLQVLAIDNSTVTDAGLVHLRGVSQMQWLMLSSTQVTDAGLVHLQALSQLRTLDLRDTKVTGEGIKKLQQALPHCRINHWSV